MTAPQNIKQIQHRNVGRVRSVVVTTKYKPYTIDELVTMIYEDNLEHFDAADDDCDCYLHITLKTIIDYWDEQIIGQMQARMCGGSVA